VEGGSKGESKEARRGQGGSKEGARRGQGESKDRTRREQRARMEEGGTHGIGGDEEGAKSKERAKEG